MSTLSRTIAAGLLLATIIGCEPGAPKISPGPEAPHGGTVVPLPEGRGFVEILKKIAPGAAKQAQIVVYFLDRSRNPLATTPTAVSLKLSDVATPPVEFKPNGEPGGLASDPIINRDDLAGDLSATVDGQTLTVPISLR